MGGSDPVLGSQLDFFGRGTGSTFQISVAYWRIARSLEKIPHRATLRIAIFAHLSRSL